MIPVHQVCENTSQFTLGDPVWVSSQCLARHSNIDFAAVLSELGRCRCTPSHPHAAIASTRRSDKGQYQGRQDHPQATHTIPGERLCGIQQGHMPKLQARATKTKNNNQDTLCHGTTTQDDIKTKKGNTDTARHATTTGCCNKHTHRKKTTSHQTATTTTKTRETTHAKKRGEE